MSTEASVATPGTSTVKLTRSLIALFALYILLVQVFGVTIEIHPFGTGR